MRNLSYFGTVNPESKKCYNLRAPREMKPEIFNDEGAAPSIQVFSRSQA